MNPFLFREILADSVELGEYTVSGWVRTHRQSKRVSFIELTDGSTVGGLQLVIEPDLESYHGIADSITTGAAITASGELVESPARGQKYEFQVKELSLVGEADADEYPLQKKNHSLEFLREVLHLRSRSQTLGAVFRVRSEAAFAIHEYFQTHGYLYVTTPIISTSDCEGAGELFRVIGFDPNDPPRVDGKVDYSQDFFKDEASLTVSGQLEAEVFALSHSRVYTFGPTFRAENSNTTRHLAEFWMIEPEIAFCDLDQNIAVAEEFLRAVVSRVLERCRADLEFLEKREWVRGSLVKSLEALLESQFTVMEYAEAVERLIKSGKKFEFPVEWGVDLQSEHEHFLTEQILKGPVFVVNYPTTIKPFYMRVNEDGRTVRAMDLLVPRLGEIIGGSQREERLEVLKSRIQELGLPEEEYWWYLDLRRFGSVPHAGFGLGFERLLMYLTGMTNIRDVVPFPRHPGFAKF